MDFSKLPKMSQAPAPPADAGAPPADAGVGTATPVKVELFCRCGAPIVTGTNFCSHCGASYYETTGGRGNMGGYGEAGGSGMWVEAFMSIAMGLLLILIAPTGVKYLSAGISGKAFTPYLHPTEPNVYVDFQRYQDQATGVITDYKYRDLFDQYWSDVCVSLFALALILEGIVLLVVRNRWVVLAAALLITGVTLLNLWYLIASYTRISPITKQAYGLPMISAIAVIFGIMMAGYQFRLFAERGKR